MDFGLGLDNCNLLQTFTTGCDLGLILRPCWFVDISMIVLAVVIEAGTGIYWWIVMLIALKGILRNPKY